MKNTLTPLVGKWFQGGVGVGRDGRGEKVREAVATAAVPSHQVNNTKTAGLMLVNVQSPYHLDVINLHPPPPRIALQCHFTWHA
jgi:hypothetical protein